MGHWYRYSATAGKLEDLGSDFEPTPVVSGGLKTSEGELYNGLHAVDGTDISSRRKRREYMKSIGATDPSDFTQHWKNEAARREREARGEITREASDKLKKDIYNSIQKLRREKR